MGTFNVLRFPLNGLPHVVYEWLPPADSKGTVVLLHGYMDAAGTWDVVADRLGEAGSRVLAPHLRGFGDGPWIGPGCYYHFPDYVLDVAALLDRVGEPVHLVGHSMGGTVAGLVAGAFPDAVRTISLLEGLGPPTTEIRDVPDRTANFVRDMKKVHEKGESRRMATIEVATDRLQVTHPAIDSEILRSRTPHLVKESEGGYVWRFDPRHRVRSAFPFFATSFNAHLARIAAPALLVSGGPTGFHPVDEKERAAMLGQATSAEIPHAGHMMHWTHPERLAELLGSFFQGN